MKLALPIRLFVSSVALGSLAGVLVRFAVAWHVLQHTQSAALVAWLVGGTTFLEVYSKPFVAPLADHHDRLAVYRFCLAASLVLTAALALSMWLAPSTVGPMAACLVLLSLVTALREPTSAALTPMLVQPAELARVQSLRATINAFAPIAGPILAGGLLAAVGTHAAAASAAAMMALALAGWLALQRLRRGLPAPRAAARLGWADWRTKTAAGFRAVLRNRCERNIAVATALVNCGVFGFGAVVVPVWVSQTLQRGPQVAAAIEMAFGLGMLAGSLALARRVNARWGRWRALAGSVALMAGSLALVWALPNEWVAGAALFAVGAGLTVFFINATTLRAVACPQRFRARLAAGVAVLSCGLHPFVIPALGHLMQQHGTRGAIGLCAAFVAAAALVLLRNRDARALLAEPDEQIVGRYERLYPQAFEEAVAAAPALAVDRPPA